TVDLDGNVVSGTRTASSETPMHLAVYTKRPDVHAVVHAHPPTATGFTVAGIPLTDNVIPEIILTLGKIPTAPYVTPSSDEGPRAVAENIAENDAILLDHHGALTVGENLIQAYFRMEKVEYAAKVLLTAHKLGGINPLTPEQLEKLHTISVYGKKYKGD
ncbi:MAG: class II aldolase/adducin family protein, partial [candidate division Zixibacteria bacterium]|nr:class II aldolase/adducin family protein [candidate division Zixibacteria bacterium]